MPAAAHPPSLRIALAVALSTAVVLALSILGGAEQGLVELHDTVRTAGNSESAGTPWRHSASDAVFFYGGYYCVRDARTRTTRLVLTLREVEVVARGAEQVVGPFTNAKQAAAGC